MELVGELAASHHLAFCQGGWRCRDIEEGKSGVRRSTDEAPPGLRADSSPPKHFSSHQSRHAGREACSSSQHHLSFFPSLGCPIVARPGGIVPSSHTPAGRTWFPASSIIPRSIVSIRSTMLLAAA